MEQTSYDTAVKWLEDHEYSSKDNGHNLGVVSLEDAKRAIRLALSTYTNLLSNENHEYQEQITGLEE
jgi:recombinational DNA repair protein (RecF pathway)